MTSSETRIKTARAVAMVWAVHMLDDPPFTIDWRIAAHPLNCVRCALDGETRASELGVTEEELRYALAADGDFDKYRRMIR